jgi:hypothetical protein
MNIFDRILFIVIAVCIPVIAIFGALNVVFRMPDLYIYEFTNNEITKEIGVGIKDEELGQFFSDFMTDRKETFSLVAEYEDGEQQVFAKNEQLSMENARKLLNDSLFLIGGAAVLAIASYWILLIKKYKYELRVAFKGGIAVFAALQVLIYSLLFIKGIRAFLHNLIFNGTFGKDNSLPQMLTPHFGNLGVFASSAVAVVLMILLTSLTWRLTKPRRMFWQ